MSSWGLFCQSWVTISSRNCIHFAAMILRWWLYGLLTLYVLICHCYFHYCVHVLLLSHFGILQWYQSIVLAQPVSFQPLFYKKEKRSKIVEGMILVSSLFISMKNLSKDVKKMKEKRCNETFRGFQKEEGPCTSYSQKKEPMLQQAPNKYTLPFYFEE